MPRQIAIAMLLLMLVGCAGMPSGPVTSSVCTAQPGSYACQVEQYALAGGA
ncbi:hypothetical protein [Variovorax sp. GT1P44]|uniref:hypothetical protein n=1 Tax=Variovorax sp. GT1P44 TaxID=3443742 RepID=UPI003F48C3E5